jgi:hypothetical protein
MFEAHHLHTDHHSPCNQVGMDRVDFPDEVDARDDATIVSYSTPFSFPYFLVLQSRLSITDQSQNPSMAASAYLSQRQILSKL